VGKEGGKSLNVHDSDEKVDLSPADPQLRRQFSLKGDCCLSSRGIENGNRERATPKGRKDMDG
jgi:hypothetical protein